MIRELLRLMAVIVSDAKTMVKNIGHLIARGSDGDLRRAIVALRDHTEELVKYRTWSSSWIDYLPNSLASYGKVVSIAQQNLDVRIASEMIVPTLMPVEVFYGNVVEFLRPAFYDESRIWTAWEPICSKRFQLGARESCGLVEECYAAIVLSGLIGSEVIGLLEEVMILIPKIHIVNYQTDVVVGQVSRLRAVFDLLAAPPHTVAQVQAITAELHSIRSVLKTSYSL